MRFGTTAKINAITVDSKVCRKCSNNFFETKSATAQKKKNTTT